MYIYACMYVWVFQFMQMCVGKGGRGAEVHVCVDMCNTCYIRCKHTHAHIEFPMHISMCQTCFRQLHFRHC